MFRAGMGEQGQVQFHQLFIVGNEARVSRIKLHNGRQPFHQHRAVGLGPGQAFQCIGAQGVHGRAEEQVGMLRRHGGYEFIGHINFGAVGIKLAVRPDHAVHRQNDGMAHKLAARQ